MNLFTTLPFGKPIDFENKTPKPPCSDPAYDMSANEMVSQFVNIKHHYRQRLGELTNDTPYGPHAKRFYCADDCAFIFDISYLEAIVRAIKENNVPGLKQDGCMVLFHGLREESPGEPGCTFGRPTLVATAYAETSDGKFLEHLKIQYPYDPADPKQNLYDGAEHPGDGSSPSSRKFFAGEKEDIHQQEALNTDAIAQDEPDDKPLVLEKCDSTKPTAFCILKTISTEKLKKNWT